MTPKQRKEYEEYLADFDPTPQHGGDDYDYPMSADAWLELQQDKAFYKAEYIQEYGIEGLRRLAQEDNWFW